MRSAVLPGAEEIVTGQSAAAETDLISVTVEEEAFSGKSAYLQLRVTAMEPKKYALRNTELSAPDEDAYLYGESGGMTGRADGRQILLWNIIASSPDGSLHLSPVDMMEDSDGSAVIWYSGRCEDRLDSAAIRIDCWQGIHGTFSREDRTVSDLRLQEEEGAWLPQRDSMEVTLSAAGETQEFELRQIGESENGKLSLLSGSVSVSPTESYYLFRVKKVSSVLGLRLEDKNGSRIEMYEGQSRAEWDKASDVWFSEQKGFMQAILPENGPYQLILYAKGNQDDVRDRVTVMLVSAG